MPRAHQTQQRPSVPVAPPKVTHFSPSACFDGPAFEGGQATNWWLHALDADPGLNQCRRRQGLSGRHPGGEKRKWPDVDMGRQQPARGKYTFGCWFCYSVLAMWAESEATAVPALIDTFSLQSAPAGKTRTICYFPHQHTQLSLPGQQCPCAKLRASTTTAICQNPNETRLG